MTRINYFIYSFSKKKRSDFILWMHAVVAACFAIFSNPAAAQQTQMTLAADIFFEPRSAELDAAAIENIRRLIKKSEARKVQVWIIVGHTDKKEVLDSQAKRLSMQRAESIKSALSRYGVKDVVVNVDGKGAKEPLADSVSVDGRAKNRRAEIEVILEPRKAE